MDTDEALRFAKQKYDALGSNKADTGKAHRALANLAQTVGGIAQAEAALAQAEAARDQVKVTEGLRKWTKILAIATFVLGGGTILNYLFAAGII